MKTITLAAVVAVLLGTAACAPASPTADPAQIQASAVAAASTIVAMTQAAAPPPTEVPPTPLPSPTPLPIPTLSELPTLSLGLPTSGPPPGAPTSSANACLHQPIASNPEGPLTTAKIANTTNGSVNLSLYLNKTKFGECGYRSYVLKPHETIVADGLPEGCYWAGAFVQDPKANTKAFGLNICLGNGKPMLTIGAGVIRGQ